MTRRRRRDRRSPRRSFPSNDETQRQRVRRRRAFHSRISRQRFQLSSGEKESRTSLGARSVTISLVRGKTQFRVLPAFSLLSEGSLISFFISPFFRVSSARRKNLPGFKRASSRTRDWSTANSHVTGNYPSAPCPPFPTGIPPPPLHSARAVRI